MRVTVLTERDVSLGLIDTGLFRANERDVQSNVFLGVTNFPIRLAVKAYSGGVCLCDQPIGWHGFGDRPRHQRRHRRRRVGVDPVGIAVDPVTSAVYVANANSNSVSIITV